MKRVAFDDIYSWSAFDERRQIDFNGHLWVREEGNILIDPVAMIESVEAVENIHDILAAPISAILMVHSDTSISMGLGPFGDIQTHPEVEAMYQVVLEACKAQDKVMCGAAYARDLHQRRLDEGWQFLLPQG